MGLQKKIKLCLCLIPLLILFSVTGAVFILSTMPGTGSCGGEVTGDSVKYVRNDIKYVPLEDLGINPDDVAQGDRIFLKFNAADEITGYELTRNMTLRNNIGLFFLYMTLILIVVIALIRWSGEGRFTSYEAQHHFFQVCPLNQKIYLCRWLVPEGGSLEDVRNLRFDKGEILSLTAIIRAKRYEHVTRMKVKIYDELHCRERTERLWIASPEYDVIKN